MIDFLEAAIRIATPLLFAALGGILSERAGVFAVGLEGMMLMGAFGGAIGAWASGSALVGVGLAIVCGAAIGLVVAIVTVAYRADNMVTGLTANILAAGLTSYLMRVLSGGGRPDRHSPDAASALADSGPCRYSRRRAAPVRAAAADLSRDRRLPRARVLSRAHAGRLDPARDRRKPGDRSGLRRRAVSRAHGSRSSPVAPSPESAARCSPCSRSGPSPTA